MITPAQNEVYVVGLKRHCVIVAGFVFRREWFMGRPFAFSARGAQAFELDPDSARFERAKAEHVPPARAVHSPRVGRGAERAAA